MYQPAISADSYIQAVVSNHTSAVDGQRALQVRAAFFPALKQERFGPFLLDAIPSGSQAKGTAIKGNSDVDLFLSFAENSPYSLSELYSEIFSFAEKCKLKPRKQRVSVRVVYEGLLVDLVPGRRQNSYTTDHSIHLLKGGDWRKTNVEKQILFVRQASRSTEIRAFKIWKEQKKLDFPSCLVELVVIEALKNSWESSLAKRCGIVLSFLQSEFLTRNFPDPGNPSNDIGGDITNATKQEIKQAAARIRTWSDFI